jgi:hypothetical protein
MSENKNQLIPSVKQPIVKVSKTLSITNKLLNEIENREPSDDFRITIPDVIFQEYLKDIGVEVQNGAVSYGDIKNIGFIQCSVWDYDKSKWKSFKEGLEIESLDGISYFKSLTIIECSGHKINTLDVSKNSGLLILKCDENQLTSLDVSENNQLRILSCDKNQLTCLDVSKNIKLTLLSCKENQITKLDVSNNINLMNVLYEGNKFKDIDTSNNPKLIDW